MISIQEVKFVIIIVETSQDYVFIREDQVLHLRLITVFPIGESGSAFPVEVAMILL